MTSVGEVVAVAASSAGGPARGVHVFAQAQLMGRLPEQLQTQRAHSGLVGIRGLGFSRLSLRK